MLWWKSFTKDCYRRKICFLFPTFRLQHGPLVVHLLLIQSSPHFAAEMITQSLKKEDGKSTSYVTSEKLLSSLTSPLYILHVLWFAFLQLRLFFFVGVLNRWLSSLADGDLDDGLVLTFLSD